MTLGFILIFQTPIPAPPPSKKNFPSALLYAPSASFSKQCHTKTKILYKNAGIKNLTKPFMKQSIITNYK